jgi:hypothetical protein
MAPKRNLRVWKYRRYSEKRYWHQYGSVEAAMEDPAYRALRSKRNPEFHPDQEWDVVARIRDSEAHPENWIRIPSGVNFMEFFERVWAEEDSGLYLHETSVQLQQRIAREMGAEIEEHRRVWGT